MGALWHPILGAGSTLQSTLDSGSSIFKMRTLRRPARCFLDFSFVSFSLSTSSAQRPVGTDDRLRSCSSGRRMRRLVSLAKRTVNPRLCSDFGPCAFSYSFTGNFPESENLRGTKKTRAGSSVLRFNRRDDDTDDYYDSRRREPQESAITLHASGRPQADHGGTRKRGWSGEGER